MQMHAYFWNKRTTTTSIIYPREIAYFNTICSLDNPLIKNDYEIFLHLPMSVEC